LSKKSCDYSKAPVQQAILAPVDGVDQRYENLETLACWWISAGHKPAIRLMHGWVLRSFKSAKPVKQGDGWSVHAADTSAADLAQKRPHVDTHRDRRRAPQPVDTAVNHPPVLDVTEKY
jgi:hypothetical protein